MIKRTLMIAAFATAAVFASSDTLALKRDASGADGCARLQGIVAAQITAVARGHAVQRATGTGGIAKPADGPAYCGRTAQATTHAFGQAMYTLGIPVSWDDDSYPGIPPGDYCLSHDLSQCYPRTRDLIGGSTAMQLSFVHDAWKAVRNGVAAQMPYGVQSDMSVFEADTLAAVLQDGLRREIDRVFFGDRARTAREAH